MADEHVSTSTNPDRFLPPLKQRRHNGIQAAGTGTEERLIIWTPTFIALFALTLVVGLSLTTILIQGWLNGHYSDKSVLLASMPLLFCAWIAVLIKAHSAWVRAGAIFGCFWSLFTAGNFWLLVVDPQSASVIQINIAADSALLATFICLSLADTPFRLWDTWFFRLLPLLAIIILGASYLHSFKEVDAFYRVESTGGTLLLYLCIAVWWLRPSCWHNQPGPAFLFSIAPLTILLFVLSDSAGRERIFFFQQIFLLCILLGTLRILQGELRRPLPGSML